MFSDSTSYLLTPPHTHTPTHTLWAHTSYYPETSANVFPPKMGWFDTSRLLKAWGSVAGGFAPLLYYTKRKVFLVFFFSPFSSFFSFFFHLSLNKSSGENGLDQGIVGYYRACVSFGLGRLMCLALLLFSTWPYNNGHRDMNYYSPE